MAAKIHVGGGNTLSVKSYVSIVPDDTWTVLHVYKSGRTTGVTDGYVKGVVELTQSGMVYHNMVNTTIPASGGDSGAPLYTKPTSSECRLYGNLKAVSGSYSYFSPISGIKNDLGVIPITA